MSNTPRICPNCGEQLKKNGHFVPPSMGESGRFICKALQPVADKLGPQTLATTIHAAKDVNEQSAAARLLEEQHKPGAGVAALSLVSALMAGGGRNQAGRHATFQVRKDVRKVSTPAELREAAHMAEQGIAMPGSKADMLIRNAQDAGDFTEQRRLVAELQALAPGIRAQADIVEQLERDAMEARVQDAAGNLRRMTAATDKRLRKAERAQQANMRHAARNAGQ